MDSGGELDCSKLRSLYGCVFVMKLCHHLNSLYCCESKRAPAADLNELLATKSFRSTFQAYRRRVFDNQNMCFW